MNVLYRKEQLIPVNSGDLPKVRQWTNEKILHTLKGLSEFDACVLKHLKICPDQKLSKLNYVQSE